jgi:hypothetical protein
MMIVGIREPKDLGCCVLTEASCCGKLRLFCGTFQNVRLGSGALCDAGRLFFSLLFGRGEKQIGYAVQRLGDN